MKKPAKAIIPERVKERREAMGLTQADLANLLGKAQQSIAVLETGGVKNTTYTDELARALQADVDYLYGRQDTPRLKNGARLYDTFDPDGKDAIEDDRMTAGSETGVRGIPEGTSPQIDVTAGMGGGGLTVISEGVPGKHGMTFAAENITDFWRVPPTVLLSMGKVSPEDITFVPVQGDSMAPTLQEGDVVVIDTRHRWPSPAGIYALNDAFGGIIVKRLEVTSRPSDEQQMVTVISDNVRHPPQVWNMEDLRIVGRVLRKFGIVQ